MSLLVLGSINRDLVVRSPRLPRPGETVLGGEFYQASGGKGANQAVAAARAAATKEEVAFLGAVGDDDLGQELRLALQAEGIDCTHLKLAVHVASGVALILVDDRGENLISVASGANSCLLPVDIHELQEATFRKRRVLLASLESPLTTVQRGLSRAKELGLTTILNPAPVPDAQAIKELLPLVDLLTPNEHELAALVGMSVDTLPAVADAAKLIQALGARQVVVTLGSQGALVLDEEGGSHHIPAMLVAAIDTTAAGDCFSGTLAIALAEGQPLLQAARFATAAAALSVTRRGAQPSLPRREEIEEFQGAHDLPHVPVDNL